MARSTRSILPRRTFLRGLMLGGVSVAVPLPRLFGMLNGNGTAYADGALLPLRFGTWFFGNGIIPDRWVPRATGTGDAWQLSEQLAPLQAVKSHLSVLSGFSIKISNNAPHASMPAAALSGAQVGGNSTQLPTIDQVIGKVINAPDTTYPQGLHVGISNVSGATSLGLAISYAGANSANPPEFSPAALFGRLLKFTNTGGMPSAPDPELLRRKQVLDAVAEDAKALRMRLGSDDQKRLDQHLDGLAQLQLQITKQQDPKVMKPIVDPDKAYPKRGGDGSITRQRGQAFSDLLVFAMSADLTRVFSYMFTCPACHGHYDDCGLDPTTFHEDFGHRSSSKGAAYATVGFNTGVKFAMSNLADTLVRMKETPDGAGNLLDSCAIMATTDTSDGRLHNLSDYPILVAGKAGGFLKYPGIHYRSPSGDENTSVVLLSMLRAVGTNLNQVGAAEGLVTTSCGAIEA